LILSRPKKTICSRRITGKVSKRLSKSIPLFITEGLKFYTEAILKIYGELMEFPRTEKKGRPKNQN
jgi:hypothetical protein